MKNDEGVNGKIHAKVRQISKAKLVYVCQMCSRFYISKDEKNRKPQPQIGYMMHCCFENDLQFKFSLIYLLMPHGIIIIQFWAQPLGITWRRVFFTSWKTVSMVITKLNYDLFSVVVAKVKPPWRLNKNMAPDQSF